MAPAARPAGPGPLAPARPAVLLPACIAPRHSTA